MKDEDINLQLETVAARSSSKEKILKRNLNSSAKNYHGR